MVLLPDVSGSYHAFMRSFQTSALLSSSKKKKRSLTAHAWLTTVERVTPQGIGGMDNGFKNARGKKLNYSFSVRGILPSNFEIFKLSIELKEGLHRDINSPTVNEEPIARLKAEDI